MLNSITEAFVTIAGFIVAVAIISVLVSPKAKTSSVIQASASGFANNIGEAISPVTGNGATPNLSYPGGGGLPQFGGGLPQFNN